MCMKYGCIGDNVCPMKNCIRHQMFILKNIGFTSPSLRCRYCSAEVNVIIPNHIPESQNYMYLEEVVIRINNGEIEVK